VFTDGETLTDNISTLRDRLAQGNVHTYFVRVWGPDERVYERGLVNTAYVPDPISETQLEGLAAQLGTRVSFSPRSSRLTVSPSPRCRCYSYYGAAISHRRLELDALARRA
jgi:hypothetical protein